LLNLALIVLQILAILAGLRLNLGKDSGISMPFYNSLWASNTYSLICLLLILPV